MAKLLWLLSMLLIFVQAGKAVQAIRDSITTPLYKEAPCEELVLAFSTIIPTCGNSADGVVSVGVIGGTPPYTYRWSNGIEKSVNHGLAAGTYTLTVYDAQACAAIDSVALQTPKNITADFEVEPVSERKVADGAIRLKVRGANPPFYIQWSGQATGSKISNLKMGIYKVTITDAAGCKYEDAVLVGLRPDCYPVAPLPHVQSFELLPGLWQTGVSGNFKWEIYTPDTSRHLAAFDGAAYIAAMPERNEKVADLQSPCLDLSGTARPVMRFAYALQGTSGGQLDLAISTDGGANWTEPVWSGNRSKDAWHLALVDLTAYADAAAVQLKFTARCTDKKQLIAIEDLHVYDEKATAINARKVDLKVSSTPVLFDVRVAFDYGDVSDFKLMIVDLTGEVVFCDNYSSEVGKNEFTLNLQAIPAGTYFLQLAGPDMFISKKFVKDTW